LKFEKQKSLPVKYKDRLLECGYRLDFLIEDKVILEIKSVDMLTPVHDAQLITYLKLSVCTAGLLLNFNVKQLKHGIKRVVNQFATSAFSAHTAV
jgi:GxxExxY protein